MTKRQMIKTVSELAALQFGSDYSDAIDEMVKEHAALLKFARQQKEFRSTPTILIPAGKESASWEALERKVKL